MSPARDAGPNREGPNDPVVSPSGPRLLGILGPGLITGAADNDPGSIATYSLAGAQLGFVCLWMMPLSYPMMSVTQEVAARIGRVTGQGLAGTMRLHAPPWIGAMCTLLLLIANVINLGADLGAMGEVAAHLAGGARPLFVVLFGATCLAMQILLQYTRYVAVLKWLTLVLLAYFATVALVRIPWLQALHGLFVPHLSLDRTGIAILVAVMGTTISPYLYFWQSSQEAEDLRVAPLREPLLRAPHQAPAALRRIRLDTWFGMALSNLAALAIILTAAATLHQRGMTHIASSAQAAEALRPLAGAFAYWLFALGIIGTGLLAVPVLAGSAAYAIGEMWRWPIGLARRPMEARAFYLTLAIATMLGAIMNFLAVDPIRALFWSAVINGVMVAPIILVMMHLASSRSVMEGFTLSLPLKLVGWCTAAVMACSVVGLAATALL